MLCFKGDKLLLFEGSFEFPVRPEPVLRCSLDFPPSWGETIPWCEVDESFEPSGGEWLDLRSLWALCGDEVFARAGAAYQYMYWLRHTRFCARCTTPLQLSRLDRGLCCPACGWTSYSTLVPAIIVAVERDGHLLLAHNVRMRPRIFSILAGFVEPGETPEQTVAREVMEEVGIEVQDIRYFGSQSWPFPSTLMLGFTARWRAGELRPDGVELDEAGWFTPETMPQLPSPVSISRRLIDHFILRHSHS
ncbi:MAG: NAD(+) diphosphatase [Fretibacterium sp.]|nr:NAD(+) diphosphatase [Fretibacterium sp.]